MQLTLIPLIQIKYVTLISILDALNPMTESSSKKPENPILEVLDNEAKQALRLQRFSMAFATYVACGLLAQACAWLGHLPPLLPTWWAIGVAVPNVVFFVMLRSGWNLRLRDPSMTEMQLVVSMFAVMVLIYNADAARSTFLMLFPVPLLFGVLRLRMYQMARVGAVGIVGYAGVIAMIAVNRPARVQLDVELLNLLALSGAMGFVCIMGGYISKVRAQLSHSLDTIRELAQRDPLTNLFNRRFLMETLTREILRRERGTSCGVVLCIIDLDHFKLVNDTFGHPIGDEVLVAVGRCIAKSIRTTDYLARYGGEEFAVLLEENSNEQAIAVCERIRKDISELQVPALQGQQLFVSIGVANWQSGDNSASLIERADRALYRAKADGRNCIRTTFFP